MFTQRRDRIDPSTLSTFVGANRIMWEGPGTNPMIYGYVTPGQSEIIRATVIGTLEARAGVFTRDNRLDTGYSYVHNGDEKPSNRSHDLGWKDVVNNQPHYTRAAATKAIVISPYTVSALKVVQTPAEDITPLTNFVVYASLKDFVSNSVNVNGKSRNFIHLGGYYYFDAGSNGCNYRVYRENVEFWFPYLSLGSFSRSALEPLLDVTLDTGLVTAALAAANTAQADILTTLVEIPETIAGVLAGFKTVAAASEKHRKGELSLSKSYASRKKFLQRALERDLAKINYQRRGANKHKIRLLERQERRVKETHTRAVNGALAEFNSALASIWMSFRYAIMPNVYAVEDCMNLIANLYSQYATVRKRIDVTIPFLIDEYEPMQLELIHRCFIKTRFDINGAFSERLLRHGSANLAVTLFELKSRSFVLDWFLNVGDFLSAAFGYNLGVERKASYSTKLTFDTKTIHSSGSKLIIYGSCYKRILIEPRDYTGITWNPTITLLRSIDSAAMIWPAIRKILLTKGK